MDIHFYLITFSAEGIADAVAMPDEQAAQVSAGYGGWSVVPRQRRVGLTLWQGKEPLRMTVPLLFDGVANGASQELMISHLSRMALPPTVGGEPPVVTVAGRSLPKPGPTKWVIDSLQWGGNVIWGLANNGVYARLRQDCIVTLLEYRADDRAAFKGLMPGKKTTANGSSKSGWPKVYHVKKGDTLRKVAARKEIYGDASKWKPIGKANGIRDPNFVLANDTEFFYVTLRVPAP